MLAVSQSNCCEGYHTLAFTKILDISDIVAKAARRIWNRDNPKGNKATELDKDIMEKEFTSLWSGVSEGIGFPTASLAYSDTRFDTVQKLRTNLISFVSFKNYNQRADMIKELIDEKGNIRSWSNYKKKVNELSVEYNQHWLEAEYNAVVAGSQTSVQWQTFQKQKNIFPYLRYKSQGDSRVRPAHIKLHDVVRHIDDPFWDTYYPPNGWKCRCYVLQEMTAGGSQFNEKKEEFSYKEHPAAFRFNSGKENKIFNNKHPYFELASKKDKEKVLDARNEFFKNPMFYDTVNGIKSHVSNYTHYSKMMEHINAAKLMTSHLGEQPSLLPTFAKVRKMKAPDMKTTKHIVEYKGIDSDKIGHEMIDPISRNINEALVQLHNNEHSDLNKVIVVKLKNRIDFDKRFINKFNKLKEDVDLYFIYENQVIKFRDLIK